MELGIAIPMTKIVTKFQNKWTIYVQFYLKYTRVDWKEVALIIWFFGELLLQIQIFGKGHFVCISVHAKCLEKSFCVVTMVMS